MNSRSSVNETNLVNFSTDLSTLNQLDAKDGLLSFPFDHIYACHSESSDRRQTLELDKEVEISTHCVVAEDKDLLVSTSSEVRRLNEQLTASENQNKKLKDLLIYHLDLIQQQNELITKRDKLYTALKQENDTLKTKLNRRVTTVSQRHRVNHSPLVHVPAGGLPPPTPVTSTVVKTEPGLPSQVCPCHLLQTAIQAKRQAGKYSNKSELGLFLSLQHQLEPTTLRAFRMTNRPAQEPVDLLFHQESNLSSGYIMLNSFTDLLLPDNRTNPFIFDSDLSKSKPFGQDTFDLSRSTEDFLQADLGVSSLLDSNLSCDNFTMIENKRSFIKKEIKTEPRSEALYTVTSNSGNPVIQRIQRNRRRTSSGLGSLSRMSKSPGTSKVEIPESSKSFDDDKTFTPNFSINKKSKLINTYGKPRSTATKKTSQFTGSLSDRLQLIDTTPTGEDPYQLGEADMREQSPIPKLMLQKTNHGRMKICSDSMGETTSTRRIYDPAVTESRSKVSNKIKLERYNLPSTYVHTPQVKKEPKTIIVEEPDLDIVKTEPEIDWRMYNPQAGSETSLCDFSYGENSNNLGSHILPSLDTVAFQELFPDSPLRLDSLNMVDYSSTTLDKSLTDRSKKRGARTTSLMGSSLLGGEPLDMKRINDSKRGRKRALSTTGLVKTVKTQMPQKVVTVAPKPKIFKGKAACRGKKSPLPGMVTRKPYHTLVGDPDLSWYLGLDPDLKLEDVDQNGGECSHASTVEVPRWREKPYTSCYTLEGTENLDDKVFEKRHQKLEAEERRQLRWHMRRIREQRHVEKLRQRQRDPWSGSGAYQQPSVFTIWPQPQRDVRFIEITDTLPVMAFGEILPAIPKSDFMLPWVRTSKALKRSKRSKTLH